MNTVYREIPEIIYQLGMYGWEIKELPEGLHIGIRGCPVVISYDYIDEVGYESIVRYCKARFILSKAYLK